LSPAWESETLPRLKKWMEGTLEEGAGQMAGGR